MVRETRHLWVGNLPDNIREDRIREHFKRYGRVQSVKLLPRSIKEETSENTTACTVAFMDIKSASKAHTSEHKIDERTLTTEYYEPAAIPSAASPQNTNTTYSTSPGSNRFTNSHGNPEEHANFNERFYDRNNSRVAEGEYIRRVNYHDNRGRNRDRGYRNGPYNNVIDRHRSLNSSWSYDSSRTYNSETGYATTPTDTTDRRSSDSLSTKKKTKSRSGSRSVSPSGSTSSRSPTRSRSQSSSSSSSSTTSQASSSTSSPKSRRVAPSANSSHQPVVHSDDRRPLAICVRNLPLRSSDTSLKDGLFHEYKKHGKVTWVKIVGQGSERHAIVCFKKPDDVDKALEVSYDKLFFGCKIEVASYQGYDVDDNELRPYEAEIDEFHPKATRTLFIGNLEKDVTASDLRKHFDQFGEIIEIDIKKQGAVSSYAFCQYSDIISVVKAIRAMDGEHLGNNRIKLGFGKSMPTDCVWVDGIIDSVNEKYLTLQFDSFGPITQVIIDRDKGQGLIFYEQVLNAQAAVAKMRGVNMRGRKMQVDFASRECQEAFYEHLEKQGHPAERTNFEERNPATRTFEPTTITTTATRFARYELPSTRPRTASYSSRSSVAASQCNTASTVHSPSTPGSATPRGSGSRSRLARLNEYYDQNSEFSERRYRSYDEYSQGSAASHEEGYEHEYATYNRESPSHLETADPRSVPHNSEHLPLVFAPPDIRNLQKERFHLLEQLEDYTSSGDELTSSKKRIKLDIIDGPVVGDVVIETNREHRKVMEVRRTSDASLKHHSRRPSIDNKHSIREISGASYLPHSICKRRKTGGSDTSARIQHPDFSGSESIGSSRPGTPLCDERPENLPTEPRRIPREREGPLSLPLPRFAAQLLGKAGVSVAGIKGQKDVVLASPPPPATSPRISNHVIPSPAHVPPPASPPPRPPSISDSDSDAPPSPNFDELIQSLDEKYEKWSGSRAVSAAGSEALAKLDATASERFRFSYKLLDLDLKELQPSDIVKSVLAKPSVFDEDLKRLENVGGKFETGVLPKPIAVTASLITAAAIPTTPPVVKTATITNPQLPKTPTMLSPIPSGSSIATAKSLQYPFPSHPPLQTVVSAPTTPTQSPLLTPPSSTTRSNQLDGRQKSTSSTSASNDSKVSKVAVNRTVSSGAVSQMKINEPSNKNGVNIPVNSSDVQSTINSADVSTEQTKGECKLLDKFSDKLAIRRDSTNSNGSPCNEIKSRRNSENNVRKLDVCDKKSDNCDISANQTKLDEKSKHVNSEQRVESDRIESERIEKVRLEKERLEKENIEKERLEKEKIDKENVEKERLERDKQDRERKEREERIRKEREEQERLEREKKERREREERERRERDERERREREDRERREREEKERREREEKERREREDRERREREELERREREEREKRERDEKERREREDRDKREREEKERREQEEKEKREREEREKREKEEQERVEKERKREDERKHKEENHEKRKDEHNSSRHREIHSDSKYKENSESSRSDKSVKENRLRDNHDLFKKESHDVRNNHENKVSHEGRERYNNDRKEEKLKHFDRDEKRKENTKENRENNLHDKIANIASEIKENNKPSIESRHFSIDLDRNRIDSGRRKERNNSLPVSIGSKRRLSSQDSLEMMEEIKKIKLSQEHRKLSEKRESKDLKLDDKNKSKHKNNIAKIIEDKMRQEKLNSVKDNTDDRRRDKDKEDKHRHKQKMEKQKSKEKEKEKSKEKDIVNPSKPSIKELTVDKEFLGRIDLQSIEESEKLQRQRKEAKEKRKQESLDGEDRRSSEDQRKSDDKRKEKRPSIDSKSRDENSMCTKSEDRKFLKKDRIRKIPQNSSDAATDSDEPKKPAHSIFDIVDDEPAYISMYDKVKARSCKNMQKQEEEKRQEKLKAKFNQLKQSRAKREEKKRSTSCDEDSDSDQDRHERSFSKIDINKRRSTKLLIMSSDDDEHGISKHRKKRDIYTDSDSDKHHTKSEHMETSDEENAKIKNLVQRKCLKSRIGSDSSDDDYNKPRKIKTELFSESEMDSSFGNMEYHKKIKEEDKYAKKEKRNKHHEFSGEEMFRSSPLPEIKTEDNFDSERMCGDMSSAEDNHESKKQKSELRKKHKKKQKRQKHSTTSEDNKTESLPNESNRDDSMERLKNLEKKKQHSKKDKKRDKNKDDDKYRDKSRKSKKSKSEMSKIELKRDGKMENIFGSFSDDSETGIKEQDKSDHAKSSSFLSEFTNDKINNYCSDSDGAMQQVEKDIRKSEEKERLREEHKKRKERKRREKEKRIREEEFNENSVDYADMGKQLEANIKDDSNDNLDETGVSVKSEEDDKGEEVVKFAEDESQEVKSGHERKEIKEKRKKRKKSKEEKHKHHHHHHEKVKVKSPEIKKEFDLLPAEDTVTEESEKVTVSSPGLPNLNDMGSPILKSPKKEESSSDTPISETTAKTPTTPKDKKRDKLIPGFGAEIDEKVHETAIKSISEFEPIKVEIEEETKEEAKPVKPEVIEDKPRVIISQEETEDAVAALLGESFGENEYSSCYSDDQPAVVASEQEESISEENIVEDLEEMRQAVQSLNTGDLEIKPETPQSEHELQIDTDTDEPEDVTLRFDQSPKTPERVDFSQPPKTPDIPNYYRPEEHPKGTVVIKATNLTSPPLLTPIKPLQPISLPSEIKKVETIVPKPTTTPVWPTAETKRIEVVKKELVPEVNCVPTTTETVIAKSSLSPKPIQTNSVISSSYNTPPVIKISEVAPKVSEPKNTDLLLSTTTTHCVKPVPQQYNVTSQHVKFNNSPLTKLPSTSTTSNSVSPKVITSSVPYNRLPITPIMMSKPFQATTTVMPQPKLARANDINACLNPEYNKEQSRVSQYLVSSQTPTRMIVQNLQLQRAITPQTIVKHIPYGVQQSSYLNQTTPKENSVDPLRNSPDQSKLLPALYPYSLLPQMTTPSVITDVKQPVIVKPDVKQPVIVKPDVKQPVIVKPDAPKPFMPVIQETPKLVSLSSTTSTSTIIQPTNKPLNLPPMQIISKTEASCPPSTIKEEEKPAVPKLETKAETTPDPQPQLAVAQVTEELNLFLKEEKQEIPDLKVAECKILEVIPKVETEKSESELEVPTVIKNTAEKLDEDKGETESIESDVSKERLSADLVIKDDGLDSKEDSDYWSAKEVNIDSVIQKVDALCSADELSDRSSEIGKDDWYDHEVKSTDEIQQDVKPNQKIEEVLDAGKEKESESLEMDDDLEQSDEKEAGGRGGRRGGRNRGRKTRGAVRGGVQTRNAKTVATPAAKRGGRGGRTKTDRKIPKLDSETADVYEFRDDADDNNKDRPRLILTIKSPVAPSTNNGNSPAAPSPVIVKEVPKEVPKEVTATSPKIENKEEFISPTNTRKSRRLQERDISKNTIDDTIEDVVRNVAITTRSGATLAQNQLRRSTRQNAGKPAAELLQKSPRAGGRKKDRRASETTDDSSEEKSVKNESNCEVEKSANPIPPKESTTTTENPPANEVVELPKEKPHQTLKAAVLRRVKGEMNSQEPMTLIDPVTGLLTEMREYEEGRYIPVGGGTFKPMPNVKLINQINKQLPQTAQILIPPKQMEPIPPKSVQSVIAVSPVVMAPQKPHTLKAHVLSSQANRVVVSQQHQPPSQPKFVSVPPPIVTQPNLVMKTNIPINQHLNISVSSPSLPPMHLSPKPNSQPNLTKPLSMPPAMKLSPQPTQPSPNQLFAAHVKQQQQQMQQQQQHIAHPMNKQQPTIHKTHFPLQSVSNIPPQVINAQVAHTKQLLKGQLNKTHGLHQQSQILTGAVASPPLKPAHHIKQPSMMGANPGRVIQGSASIPIAGAKNSLDSHKVDSCVMVPHPTSSPQGQPGRNILQNTLPMPAYEATVGEALAHFPPGSVKLRPPHDILPAHYMPPQHVMYQQYLRQPYHLPRSPLVSSNIEKSVDGQEGEEAPVELRRPGSVGLALTGRSLAVPLSLHSPHDRSTDSPQVSQVYNINSRLQHYHSGRYFDSTEPPPAHRPITSHASYGDRPIGQIGSLGNPERPMSNHLPSERSLGNHLPPERHHSGHLPPDRPLSGHSTLPPNHMGSLGAAERSLSAHLPEKPLSAHGFTLGAGLGAAGNLMGAVARHVGAEAPATQRGLQAATPPHASQVPPQAESLLMLLKQYPCMWQGLLALKNDQAAVQMYFVSGNDQVAKCSLPKNTDGSTPPLRIFQRMRLEPLQVEGVARKMQMENEHCMLLALPCGHDHMDVLKQSTNLTTGFITYLQQKQAAGIVNVAAPGTTQPAAYVVHIFPSCDFVNENLRRIAPNLLERVSDIAHLLIVITTVCDSTSTTTPPTVKHLK